MSDSLNVTLVGHSSSGLNSLETALQNELDFDLSRKLLRGDAVDPFEDLPTTSNIVVLDLGENWREVLVAVSSRSARSRAPTILIGPEGNTEMMRLALKTGAKDFHTHPVSPADLATTIRQVAAERPDTGDGQLGELCVFMPAKGGAGASAIAASVAHSVRLRTRDTRVMLMDLDLQHGNLPLYFDESSSTKLTQALVTNERIDTTLLDACLIKTEDGIDLLASHSDQVFSAWETPQQTVNNLLNLVCSRYEHVLVDIPRQIDPITFQAIERASRVCIVMQQSLSDLRYTRQIINLLRDQGIANEKLMIIVNRHEKSNVVRTSDITDAFDGLPVMTVPNDYKRMSYANENGISLIGKWRSAPVSKSLGSIADTLWPTAPTPHHGLFGLKFANGNPR